MKKKLGDLTLKEIRELLDNNDCEKYDYYCNGCPWQHLYCAELSKILADIEKEVIVYE